MNSLRYVTENNPRMWLFGCLSLLLSGASLFVFGSIALFSFGLATAALMQWPMVRQFASVCCRVAIHGRWPEAK